jgi:hypothetical protein
VPLPQRFTQAAALLRQQCAERLRGGQVSSFVIAGRDGVPADPEGGLPSPLYHPDQDTTASRRMRGQPGRQAASYATLWHRDEQGALQIRGGYAQRLSPRVLDLECRR